MSLIREIYFPDPVERAVDLFDRHGSLAQVQEGLRYRTTVIMGGRLVGKTSLLNVAAQWADEHASFAVTRIAPVTSRVELMAEIIDCIHEWVITNCANGTDLGELADVGRTVAQFKNHLTKLGSYAPGVRFVLCVDEFDSVLEACDERDARQILDLIVHLVTVPGLPIRLFMTMTRAPELIQTSYRSPILNQATIVKIEPWPESQASKFVDWLVQGQLVLDDAARRALFVACGGHPYFTKAVIHILQSARAGGYADDPVSAAEMESAIRRAARAPEVNLALSNLVNAHIPDVAVTMLDRLRGGSVARRNTGLTGDALKGLVECGLIGQDGDRYSLRLGIWRDWRELVPADSDRRGVLRFVDAVKRVVFNRVITNAIMVILGVSVLVLIVSTMYLLPMGTHLGRGCGGPASAIQIRAAYPKHLSRGDTQDLQLIVVNSGSVDSANGSIVVKFPAGGAELISANSITYRELRPGEQMIRDVSFTTVGSSVPVALLVSENGVTCPTQQWSMSAAPVPRLKLLQKSAVALFLFFFLPFVVELMARRFRGRGHKHEENVSAHDAAPVPEE